MLPAATEKVWSFLSGQSALNGFILVGGTALALHLRHRLSEDLDLVCLAGQLPRARLDALRVLGRQAGHVFSPDTDQSLVEQFADAGLDLLDYQQNDLVDGSLRVSFFVAEPPLARVLSSAPTGPVRIGTLAELFKSKSLVSAVRSKTRDWLDLYLLMRDYGFKLSDYRQAFVEAGIESQWETGLARLCSGQPHKDDEGYAHLLDAPPSLVDMAAFFRAERDRLETGLAEAAARERPSSQDRHPV
jgi:hypothetical protein